MQHAGEEGTSASIRTVKLAVTLRAGSLEALIGPGSADYSAGDFGLFLDLSMEIL